jgi:hypothetical protein
VRSRFDRTNSSACLEFPSLSPSSTALFLALPCFSKMKQRYLQWKSTNSAAVGRSKAIKFILHFRTRSGHLRYSSNKPVFPRKEGNSRSESIRPESLPDAVLIQSSKSSGRKNFPSRALTSTSRRPLVGRLDSVFSADATDRLLYYFHFHVRSH